MKPAGLPGRSSGRADSAGAEEVIALLLFEAAGCLMAVPASEVSRSDAVDAMAADGERARAPAARIDLGRYLGGDESEGPWLWWRRGMQSASLRVARVVEVMPCALDALRPMPVAIRAGAFWAVGVRDEDVFLMMDPAKLARDDRGASGGGA